MTPHGSSKSVTQEAKVGIIKKARCGQFNSETAEEYGIKKNTNSVYLKKN